MANRMRRTICSVFSPIVFASIALSASPARAQVPAADDGRTVVPRDTANAPQNQTLFGRRDAMIAAGFVGVTLTMFPVDRQIAQGLQNEELRANQVLEKSANGFEVISSPGAYYIGGSMYLLGRLARQPDLADVGWHGTESVLIATGVTHMLKRILGRSRPFVTNASNPNDFGFGKGFATSERQSFPSGHTATAFAAAAAVTSEVRRMWPKYTWYVAPVLYGGATMVGLSRMYHNKHWASDVVLGAAVGTFSGLKVVRYSHAHPDNLVDRLILNAVIAPDGHGGGYLGFSVPTH